MQNIPIWHQNNYLWFSFPYMGTLFPRMSGDSEWSCLENISFSVFFRTLCSVVSVITLACVKCFENCWYMLLSNKLTVIVDLLTHNLAVSILTESANRILALWCDYNWTRKKELTCPFQWTQIPLSCLTHFLATITQIKVHWAI